MTSTTFAGISDQGLVRKENQDRWYADPDLGLYLVADGMGGTAAGALAAKAVVEILPRLLARRLEGIEHLDQPEVNDRVLEAMSEMSDRLHSESKDQPGISGLGSTVALALVRGRHALVAHLGDSRVYLLRGRDLEQLTKDHTIVQLLLDCGEIEPDEAADHPARGTLTRFVGMKEESLPEARLVELAPGDRLLLCTDGLTGMVDDGQLLSILTQQPTEEAACRQLVSAANKVGGKDNITAMIVSVPESSDP